ncbi:hypothetical protein [Celeribacter sp.]|uniref:hypothetical protein n=1 Tax=Celeribacter sp. TaxID=1890673 RepID=UPI003A8E022D
MRKSIIAVSFLAATVLSGCLESQDMQNAAIGAGIGCIAGEIIRDGKCVDGAVVGGLGGALYNDL